MQCIQSVMKMSAKELAAEYKKETKRHLRFFLFGLYNGKFGEVNLLNFNSHLEAEHEQYRISRKPSEVQ